MSLSFLGIKRFFYAKEKSMIIKTYAPSEFLGFASKAKRSQRAYRSTAPQYRLTSQKQFSPAAAMLTTMLKSAAHYGEDSINEESVRRGIAAFYRYAGAKSSLYNPAAVSRLAANYATAYNIKSMATYKSFSAKFRFPKIRIPKFSKFLDALEWAGNVLKSAINSGLGVLAIYTVFRAIVTFFGVKMEHNLVPPEKYYWWRHGVEDPRARDEYLTWVNGTFFGAIQKTAGHFTELSVGANLSMTMLLQAIAIISTVGASTKLIQAAYKHIKEAIRNNQQARADAGVKTDERLVEALAIIETVGPKMTEKQRQRVEALLQDAADELVEEKNGFAKVADLLKLTIPSIQKRLFS